MYLILFILIVVIAMGIGIWMFYSKKKKVVGKYELNPSPLMKSIIDSLGEKISEIGTSKYLEDYFKMLLNFENTKIDGLKVEAADLKIDGVRESLNLLYLLIQEYVNAFNISSVKQFLVTSKMSYKKMQAPSIVNNLRELRKNYSLSVVSKARMKDIFSKCLSEESIDISEDTKKREFEVFAPNNIKIAFRAGKETEKKVSDIDKHVEIDELGCYVAATNFIRRSLESYKLKTKVEKIFYYLDELGIIKVYPELRMFGDYTLDDLLKKLESVLYKIRFDQTITKDMLKELEREREKIKTEMERLEMERLKTVSEVPAPVPAAVPASVPAST